LAFWRAKSLSWPLAIGLCGMEVSDQEFLSKVGIGYDDLRRRGGHSKALGGMNRSEWVICRGEYFEESKIDGF